MTLVPIKQTLLVYIISADSILWVVVSRFGFHRALLVFVEVQPLSSGMPPSLESPATIQRMCCAVIGIYFKRSEVTKRRRRNKLRKSLDRSALWLKIAGIKLPVSFKRVKQDRNCNLAHLHRHQHMHAEDYYHHLFYLQ